MRRKTTSKNINNKINQIVIKRNHAENEPDLAIAVRLAEEKYLAIKDEGKPSNKGIVEAINDSDVADFILSNN